MRRASLCALVVAAVAALAAPSDSSAAFVPGESAGCSDFRLRVLNILDLITVDFDIADEGWVWVNRTNPGPRYESVSGFVTRSKVARNDTPANHNSHDQNTDIEVDEGFEQLLSTSNGPNTEGADITGEDDGADDLRDPTSIEMEWEIGTFPGEKGQSVPDRYFPRWAWPSVGDRVWTNGHWVFDCGHGKPVGTAAEIVTGTAKTLWRSEIHTGRAIASMRRQAATLPGTGTTPVPVTATDLYVHGHGGFMVQQLFCGMAVVIDGYDEDGDGDGDGDVDGCPQKSTPIDADYEFDVCLPVKPPYDARLAWSLANGPRNTVDAAALELQVTVRQPAPAGCANDRKGPGSDGLYDTGTALHVRVPLAASGVTPDDVYARRLVAGWVHPPSDPLAHLRMTLFRVNLHDSKEGDTDSFGFGSDDGELTFWWANVDRAPREWVRLADTAPVADNGNSVLNDYDPDIFGNSFVALAEEFDFYAPTGTPIGINSNGYDQDCYDDYYGDHHFSAFEPYVVCGIPNAGGNNDSLDDLAVTLDAPAYGSDPALELGDCPGFAAAIDSFTCNVTTKRKCRIPIAGCDDLPEGRRPDYELDFTVERLPLALEDTADLAVSKSCTAAGEVLLPGEPAACTITVTNNGPGLPDGVTVTDTRSGAGSLGTPSVTSGGSAVAGAACSSSASSFSCSVPTIPVGETIAVAVTLTPASAGSLTNAATVATGSTDPTASNDSDTEVLEVFLPVTIDVRPGGSPNAVNLGSNGSLGVAIVTTPSFDATTVDGPTVCFGSAVDPSLRDCTETHGEAHAEDFDRDRDLDLVLHYDVQELGLDPTSTQACLKGRLRSGVGIFGCDAVVPR